MKIKIACVGDSITYGYGIADREENSYPAQLQRMLGDEYQIGNFGTNRTTVFKNGGLPYWKVQAYQKAKAFLPDRVVLLFGANCSNNTNWRQQQSYASDYFSLIESFACLSSNPSISLCLPVPAFRRNFGVNPVVIREEIIPRLNVMSRKGGFPLIDLYSPLAGHPAYFPDAVHPNKDGATIIASTVANAMKSGPTR